MGGFVLLVACGTPASTPPSVVVQGLTNEDLLYTVTIVDEMGDLENAEAVPAESTGISLSNPAMEAIAADPTNDQAIYVAWVGLPCEDRPRLRIAAGDSGLVVELDKGPQREGEACPFYPHYFAVRLMFSHPVDADTIRLQLAG
jgi:hypothetical protein